MIADQTLWFKGNDVANSLEYANPRDALQSHVDAEDKMAYSESTVPLLKAPTIGSVAPNHVAAQGSARVAQEGEG